MTITFWIYTISGLLACAGFVLILKSTFGKSRYKQKRGATPSQNASLVASTTDTGKGGGVSAMPIPRDPQQYTKAMSPKK